MGVSFYFALMLMVAKNIDGVTCNTETKEIQRGLALQILASSIESRKSTVVSILPLQFAFCKLASIATGKAKEELMKALGFADDNKVKSFYQQLRPMLHLPFLTDLMYVNKIYLDYTRNVDTMFAVNSTFTYGVHVDRVSFNTPRLALNFINNGIATGTLRRVEHILDQKDVTINTSLLLLTAEHYKPSWEEKFDSDLTRNRPFKTLDKAKVNIPMMSRATEYQIYEARDFRVIKVKLGCPGCSITFVQPDFLPIDEVLRKLVNSPDLIRDLKKQMTWRRVRLVLPRIKIKNHVDFDDVLKSNGIREIFASNSTGLNAIRKGNNGANIFVSKVRQKLFLEIDEFGFSRVHRDRLISEPMEHPDTVEYVLDRPFYFTVNLEFFGAFISKNQDIRVGDSFELFSGVYYGPE